MIEWLEGLPTAAAGIVIVGGFLLATLGVGAIVGKAMPREMRMEHNDLAGFILAVIGVIYAVLLAFVTIGVWERFQQAESRSYEEAGALAVIYRDADSFPQQQALRGAIRTYTETVVADEWPKMKSGRQSDAADAQLEKVDRIVRHAAGEDAVRARRPRPDARRDADCAQRSRRASFGGCHRH